MARGGAPAERWIVDGGPAAVGVIASVTRPFCGACDRTRLTADGQVRSCLFARTETDLRAMLRGLNDDEACDLLRFAVEGGYELRFIEQMPLDAQHGWERTEMVTAG